MPVNTVEEVHVNKDIKSACSVDCHWYAANEYFAGTHAPQQVLLLLPTAACNIAVPVLQIRDLYMTFRNFRNRITDFLRFRQVTARMDRFPDATPADLERCDGICIICREEMVAAGLNKKLHCGHVFHLHCLRCAEGQLAVAARRRCSCIAVV